VTGLAVSVSGRMYWNMSQLFVFDFSLLVCQNKYPIEHTIQYQSECEANIQYSSNLYTCKVSVVKYLNTQVFKYYLNTATGI